MGCDVHMYVERKVNNVWTAISGESPYKKMYKEIYDNSPNDEWARNAYQMECNPVYEGWIYNDRNYTLFSILANVRNGIDKIFLGPATGHQAKPISNPKGIPDDVSDKVRKCYDDFGRGSHSTSYFTLKQLKEYNLDEEITYVGLVDRKEYARYLKNGNPESWCGGSNAKLISNQDMEDWINGKVEFHEMFVQTLLRWKNDAHDCGLENIIRQLENLEENPDNIRIVFWFDN